MAPLGNASPPPEDCLACETISICLPNLEVLSDREGKATPVSSPTHKIGGLTWRVEVHKVVKEENEPAKLDLYVFCNEDVKEQLWLCKVYFTVHSGYLDPSAKLTYSYNHFYGFNTYYWILLDIFNQNNIIPHLEKSPIEIKLDLKICRAPLNKLPPLETNLVVNIGESRTETLLINKYALASLSTYFRNLFFEDWCDKREQGGNYFELIESGDFDMEAFKFMVYAAMTMGWMVHESNFLDYSLSVEILKLSIKYDVAVLVDYCEKYLIEAKNYSKMDLLELADQYGLVQLKEHCLKEMSTLDYMEDFSKNTEIHARLSKSTREQLQSKLDGKAKELQENIAEMEESIRAVQLNTTLVEPFNKLAKSLLGQRASTLSVTDPAAVGTLH